MNKELEKAKLITVNDIECWHEAKSKADLFQEEIVERIDYIIKTIFKSFDEVYSSWYFDGAEEGQVGEVPYSICDNETVSVVIYYDRYDCRPPQGMNIIDKSGKELTFRYGDFPARWLSEDFEEELIAGNKLYNEKSLKDKASRQDKLLKKKLEQESVLKKVKEKLTKDELKILKASLK